MTSRLAEDDVLEIIPDEPDHRDPPPGGAQTHHWTMLVLSVLILGAAAGLTHRTGEVVSCGPFRLPPTCVVHALTGRDCPGCGLTRSFIHLAHGDWLGAARLHPVGPALFLMVVLQVPYRLAVLAGHGPRSRREAVLLKVPGWILLAALLVNAIARAALAGSAIGP